MIKPVNNIHAVLFGLSEDLATELCCRLKACIVRIEAIHGRPGSDIQTVMNTRADIIFCGPDPNLVGELRTAKPCAAIVVVSRDAEVNPWLDAIEAGATDYCAAPFETAQVRWIVESSMRATAAAA